MLTDAAVTHFAAEECKMRDGESKKLLGCSSRFAWIGIFKNKWR